jgi:hypothetical protein
MRPFGHTGAREEREHGIAPLDERLDEAWKEFVHSYLLQRYSFEIMACADRLLDPIRPTKDALDYLILRTNSYPEPINYLLGLFVTVGYQLLPEKEIVYTLDTPAINNVGDSLAGKHLIVDGTLGNSVGHRMSGKLTINGTVGDGAGYLLWGTAVNNGHAGDAFGLHQVGTLINNGHAGDGCAESLLGTVINHGTLGKEPAKLMRGMRKGVKRAFGIPLTEWDIKRSQRTAFLDDVEQAIAQRTALLVHAKNAIAYPEPELCFRERIRGRYA